VGLGSSECGDGVEPRLYPDALSGVLVGLASANIYTGMIIVCHETVFLPCQLIYSVIGHRIWRVLWGDPGGSADLKFSLRARYKYR